MFGRKTQLLTAGVAAQNVAPPLGTAALMQAPRQPNVMLLQMGFGSMDVDQDRFLSVEELTNVFNSVNGGRKVNARQFFQNTKDLYTALCQDPTFKIYLRERRRAPTPMASQKKEVYVPYGELDKKINQIFKEMNRQNKNGGAKSKKITAFYQKMANEALRQFEMKQKKRWESKSESESDSSGSSESSESKSKSSETETDSDKSNIMELANIAMNKAPAQKNTCRCMANGEKNEDLCESEDLSMDKCLSLLSFDGTEMKGACHWGPGQLAECSSQTKQDGKKSILDLVAIAKGEWKEKEEKKEKSIIDLVAIAKGEWKKKAEQNDDEEEDFLDIDDSDEDVDEADEVELKDDMDNILDDIADIGMADDDESDEVELKDDMDNIIDDIADIGMADDDESDEVELKNDMDNILDDIADIGMADEDEEQETEANTAILDMVKRASGGRRLRHMGGMKQKKNKQKKNISYSKWINGVMDHRIQTNYPFFQEIDRNNSGRISLKEWLRYFRPNGRPLDFQNFQSMVTSNARNVCQDPRPVFLTTDVDSKMGKEKLNEGPNRDNSEDEEALEGVGVVMAEMWGFIDQDKNGFFEYADLNKFYQMLDRNNDNKVTKNEMEPINGHMLNMCYQAAVMTVDEDKKCELTDKQRDSDLIVRRRRCMPRSKKLMKSMQGRKLQENYSTLSEYTEYTDGMGKEKRGKGRRGRKGGKSGKKMKKMMRFFRSHDKIHEMDGWAPEEKMRAMKKMMGKMKKDKKGMKMMMKMMKMHEAVHQMEDGLSNEDKMKMIEKMMKIDGNKMGEKMMTMMQMHDKNGDGMISPAEFMNSMMPADFDKDKRISVSEWLMMITYHEKKICRVFEPVIDKLIEMKNQKKPTEEMPTYYPEANLHSSCRDWEALVNDEIVTQFTDKPPVFWQGIQGDCAAKAMVMGKDFTKVRSELAATRKEGLKKIYAMISAAEKKGKNPLRADQPGSDEFIKWASQGENGVTVAMPAEIAELAFDKCPTEVQEVDLDEVYYKLNAIWKWRQAAGIGEPQVVPRISPPEISDQCEPKYEKALYEVSGQFVRAILEGHRINSEMNFMDKVIAFYQ